VSGLHKKKTKLLYIHPADVKALRTAKTFTWACV